MKVYAVLLGEGDNLLIDKTCLGIFDNEDDALEMEDYIQSYFEDVNQEYDYWTNVEEFEINNYNKTCLEIIEEVDAYEKENDKDDEDDELISVTCFYKSGKVVEKRIKRG